MGDPGLPIMTIQFPKPSIGIAKCRFLDCGKTILHDSSPKSFNTGYPGTRQLALLRPNHLGISNPNNHFLGSDRNSIKVGSLTSTLPSGTRVLMSPLLG